MKHRPAHWEGKRVEDAAHQPILVSWVHREVGHLSSALRPPTRGACELANFRGFQADGSPGIMI